MMLGLTNTATAAHTKLKANSKANRAAQPHNKADTSIAPAPTASRTTNAPRALG
jgi:hypothetical protein